MSATAARVKAMLINLLFHSSDMHPSLARRALRYFG
jgi:hypothetical protein